jgi:hypothetical protein
VGGSGGENSLGQPSSAAKGLENSRLTAEQRPPRISHRTSIGWAIFVLSIILVAFYRPAPIRPEFWFKRLPGSVEVSSKSLENEHKKVRESLEKHAQQKFLLS